MKRFLTLVLSLLLLRLVLVAQPVMLRVWERNARITEFQLDSSRVSFLANKDLLVKDHEKSVTFPFVSLWKLTFSQNGSPVYGQKMMVARMKDGSNKGYGLQRVDSIVFGRRIKARPVESNMVWVEGGTFQMGATAEQGSDAYSIEKPKHSVTLSGYYIGKYEVTQRQWTAVMGSNPSSFKGDDLPVETVSWDDCQEFIRRLNLQTGKRYRLPTEAEWEYAARGGKGSRQYKYSGSHAVDQVAWCSSNSSSKTHTVGGKQPNELGIYDMSGNVWEWCSDWFGTYGSSAQTNPTGPATGSYRVSRGGCWYYPAIYCRVSNRNFNAPSFRFNRIGLRLVLSP